jgi:biopolymer transport protein ExbD
MAYRPSAGRNQRGATGPKEPDLVPIMNLFITIIPFLMLMLVISQVALVALNFTQGTGGGSEGGEGGGGDLEQAKLEVIVMASENAANKVFPGFEVREEGRDPILIPLVNLQYDYPRLDDALSKIRERNPEVYDISVSPYPDVRYEHLIKTIDLCKEHNFVNVRYEPAQVRYF